MFTSFLLAILIAPQHGHVRSHTRHSTRAQKPVDEEPGIRAGYADVAKAFETKNWSLFRSRVSPNFKQELPNHQVLTLKQTIAGLRSQFAPLSDVKAVMNVQAIRVTGSTAEGDARFSADGKMKDKAGVHKVHMEGSETDSLKKIGGRWVASYVKIHDQSVTVDGHVVSHMP